MDRGTRAVSAVVDTLLLGVYLSPLVYTIPADYSVVITATLAVLSGSLRTLGSREETETMTHKEAMRFPLIGSISLGALFVAIKFVPKHWVTFVVTLYFCAVAIFAVAGLLVDGVHSLLSAATADKVLIHMQNFSIPFLMPEPGELKVTVADMIAHVLGLAAAAWYVATKHYLANNGLGLAFSIEGISMLNIGSTQTGVLLLAGLFLYDIFWVFCTPVMVTVAKGIDGPIKLLFPKFVDGAKQFGMLGLGDIVIPGIFVAMMLHFDKANKSGNAYFTAATIGYVSGLGTTIYVMNAFKAAQPALLYIVPCVLAAVFLCAFRRGEVTQLWKYQESDEKSTTGKADGAADEGEAKEADAVEDKKAQ